MLLHKTFDFQKCWYQFPFFLQSNKNKQTCILLLKIQSGVKIQNPRENNAEETYFHCFDGVRRFALGLVF